MANASIGLNTELFKKKFSCPANRHDRYAIEGLYQFDEYVLSRFELILGWLTICLTIAWFMWMPSEGVPQYGSFC